MTTKKKATKKKTTKKSKAVAKPIGEPVVKKEEGPNLPANERVEKIVKAATVVAHRMRDFRAVTLDQVAEEANCSRALVLHYFKNATELREYILMYAIEKGLHHIVIHGIVHEHPLCKDLTKEQRQSAIDTLGY